MFPRTTENGTYCLLHVSRCQGVAGHARSVKWLEWSEQRSENLVRVGLGWVYPRVDPVLSGACRQIYQSISHRALGLRFLSHVRLTSFLQAAPCRLRDPQPPCKLSRLLIFKRPIYHSLFGKKLFQKLTKVIPTESDFSLTESTTARSRTRRPKYS